MLRNEFKEGKKEIIVEENEGDSLSIFEQTSLKKPKSFQELDKEKTVSLEGSGSCSFDGRQSSKGFKLSFLSNEVSDLVADKNVFLSGKYSRWGESKKLPSLADSGNNVYSVNEKSLPVPNMKKSKEGAVYPKADFKTLLKIFLQRSSIYALNQVGNSSTTRRKLFWLLITIVGLLGSGIQIGQYLIAYYSYPVIVNIDSINNRSQEFPAVTVCNLNSVRREFLPCLKERRNYSECNIADNDDVELDVYFVDDLYGSTCDVFERNASDSLIKRFLWRNLLTMQDHESREWYGHQGRDFIRSCSYNGEKCRPEDFLPVMSADYGNCFSFNAANGIRPVLNTSFVGPNGGLELELDIEVHKYAHFTAAVGARLEIHDPHRKADVLNRGINVSPGFETSVTLSKLKYVRLEKPYKDQCYRYAAGESMETCISTCCAEEHLNKCACHPENKFDGIRRCDYSRLSDLCCLYSTEDELSCECPVSCEDIDYDINIFSAVWPSTAYNKVNPIYAEDNSTLRPDQVRETRLKLKVYYDTLVTTVYQQKAMYQSSELFSQIGGQIGLWLGLSLVAVFECIENLIFIWKYRAEKLLQKN